VIWNQNIPPEESECT